MTSNEGTVRTIVIGADPHKDQPLFTGLERALAWGRGLDGDRVWAIEDCRHVSGPLERLLVARGERVGRIAPKLMAGAPESSRRRGKSDPIDADAVARAALREGVDTLPSAFLDEQALEIRLLFDHHDDLVTARTADQGRPRWHLHDLEYPIAVPTVVWTATWALAGQPAPDPARASCPPRARADPAGTREVRELGRELASLVAAYHRALRDMPGCGPPMAAKVIAETACASALPLTRSSRAPLAWHRCPRPRGARTAFGSTGSRPPAQPRLHRLAVNQGIHHPPARDYITRKHAEGKNNIEALPCLEPHLARTVFKTMTTNANAPARPLALT